MSEEKRQCMLFMRVKRKDLKWYQKIWNVLIGRKEQNYKWIPVNNGEK